MPAIAGAIGKWREKYALRHKSQALALVTISAHGSDNRLQLAFGTDGPNSALRGDYLAALVSDMGSGPTIVIISACYSASLIPALRAPNRVIITAAAADRVSFGCGAASTSTVFIQALLDRELDRTLSLRALFARAQERVTGFEARTGIHHSLPQIDVGADMEAFAASPISQWSKALRDFRVSKR